MSIDWTASMQRTYEFYTVNPISWYDVDRVRSITSCSVSYDLTADTLGNASITMTEPINEEYIRIYMVCKQGNQTERRCLGTFLFQAPSIKHNGKYPEYSCSGYTPLIEMTNIYPPYGYTIRKGQKVLDIATSLVKDFTRAPVVTTTGSVELDQHYVADTSNNWLQYLSTLIQKEKYRFDLDDKNRVLFSPIIEPGKMQSIWTFDDGNSSILMPDITLDKDIFSVPNVVEVYASTTKGTPIYVRVENQDSNSPTSTVSRGREIMYRASSPEVGGNPTRHQMIEYAKYLLEELSSLECTVTFSHAYCPVKIGDCVRINYERSGIHNIKAQIKTQQINCDASGTVSESATYKERLFTTEPVVVFGEE